MTGLVAVVRPEPGASATAKRLRMAGQEPLLAPLFTIEPVIPPDAGHGQFDALMMTSANAARHGGDQIRQYPALPIYAVGQATADAIRPLTNAPILLAPAGNAQSLVDLAQSHGVRRMLHVCGEDVRPLFPHEIEIIRRIVYRTAAMTRLPVALEDEWAHIGCLLLHSPRAASCLDNLVNAADLPRQHIRIIAISAATAEAAGRGWQHIHIADQPNDDAMLAVVRQLCQ